MKKSWQFDLETAIRAWRQSLTYNRVFLEEDLDELERHIRDTVAASNEPDETAFRLALRTIGQYDFIEREYKKVFWGKLKRRRSLGSELVARIAMAGSYLTLAARKFRRHPGFFLVSSSGLALGIACCLLIGLYVADELSYDRFHANADRIYRLNGTSFNPEGDFYRTRIPPPVAPTLADKFPEVESVVRVVPLGRSLIRSGNATHQEDRIVLADASFLQTFSFPLVEGDGNALAVPGSVVLTESTAERLFGEAGALGESFVFENSVELTVTGIARDVPANSHLQFDFAAAIETPGLGPDGWLDNWGRSAALTYAMLGPNGSAPALESALPRFVDTYMRASLDDEERYVISMQALPDIHLYPHLAPEQVWAASMLKYIYLLSAIGLFVLLIASINYVNLATAEALKRAREVGVRKVLGSNRKQLVAQFLGESSLMTAVSMALAVALVLVLLPAFNALSDRALEAASLAQADIIFGLLLTWIVVSLGSGSYPALYLSGFRPAAAMRGSKNEQSSGRAPIRNSLVVVQFTTAVVLIVGTMVVYRQLSFMNEKDLGYDREQVVLLPVRDPAVWQNADALKDQLRTVPGVRSASFSSGVPNAVGWNSTARWDGPDGSRELEMNHIMMDYEFVGLFDLEVVAGRSFSEEFPSDETAAYVVNETAARAMGWDDPIGKNMAIWSLEGPVIGVVKDFHYDTLHQPIGPLALHFGQRRYTTASLKIEPENVSGTLDGIEAVMSQFMPDRPFEYRFLDETFDGVYRAEERFGNIAGYLTILALFLACLGLMGLTASVVEQRTKEIGIRKALGASVPGLVALLSRGHVRLVLIGFVLATPLAWFVMNRWLNDFAYRIGLDAGLFLLAGAATLIVALLTIGRQALKAVKANPVESLRYE